MPESLRKERRHKLIESIMVNTVERSFFFLVVASEKISWYKLRSILHNFLTRTCCHKRTCSILEKVDFP